MDCSCRDKWPNPSWPVTHQNCQQLLWSIASPTCCVRVCCSFVGISRLVCLSIVCPLFLLNFFLFSTRFLLFLIQILKECTSLLGVLIVRIEIDVAGNHSTNTSINRQARSFRKTSALELWSLIRAYPALTTVSAPSSNFLNCMHK